MENQPAPDFERRMEFILEQQAKFAVDIQRLQEAQERLERAQERTDGMLRSLIEVSFSLVNHLEATNQRLDRFIAATEERFKGIDERMGRLIEAQEHTDRRLDALIDVVDKLVRRNGGRPTA